MAELVFWISALSLAHTYFAYPLVLVVLDAFRRASRDLRYLSGGGDRRRFASLHAPKVTLLVSAWNEAPVIGKKIENSLSLDYPPDKLEILVGSDGSDDGTDEIVASFEEPRVQLSTAPRMGKVGVLNRLVPQARGEILVFSDANTLFDPAAIRMLVRHFQDPSVGLVCGRLRLYNPSREGYEESTYWTYETFLKFMEGKWGAVMGANGGIYALRRDLWEPLPGNTVVEDFVVAGRCILRGKKVIFDPEAVAYEETTEDYGKERARRTRIAAGNFQALASLRELLLPSRPFVAFAFLSHKVLRWLAPFFLLGAFVSNFFLADRSPYGLTLLAQLGFYGLALAGYLGYRRGMLGGAASTARYFTEMNWGILQGFFRWLRGSQRVTWDRTARNAPPA
jgi:cellulose synthase/poly-beta-1,6-N-acetylglucosamine synthase-like glycosyltransferase